MPFSLGDTFLNKSSSGLSTHLWIVISEPTHSLEQVIIVNFTSCRDLKGEDHSCLLNNKEHPFVKHETYINYREARIVSICNLAKSEALGLLTRNESVDEILLDKILKGAEASPFLKLEIRKILEDQHLI